MLKQFALNFALFLAAVLLFAAAHPNLLLPRGFFPAGWLAYIPLFALINRVNLPLSAVWGAAYGYLAYNALGYWLAAFHPLAGIITGALELFWFTLLFPLLRLSRRSPLTQTMLWCGFEWLRTLGFAGYPYGLTAYSQWQFTPLIQIAAFAGLWAVSALVIYPQAFIASLLRSNFQLSTFNFQPASRRSLIPAAVYAAVLAGAFIYGKVFTPPYASERHVKIALVQPNNDPWKGGIPEYRDNLRVLTKLSDAALAEAPDTELVVWPETAFVPRIYWHENYRDDPDSYALVRALLDYLSGKEPPFLIGNDDARLEMSEAGQLERVDYNAAMLFEKGRLKEQYRKLHLVPFTEYFPYQKQFPQIYEWLLAADTHFWKRGDKASVFDTPSRDGYPIRFSTPICFEDSFSDLSREFTLNGAEIIVNISNDAWSSSLPGQYQHLSMAVFRAVENRRAMVRATASGQTCWNPRPSKKLT